MTVGGVAGGPTTRTTLRGLTGTFGLAWGAARGSLLGYVLVTVVGAVVPVSSAWLLKLVLDSLTRQPVAAATVLGLAVGLAVTAGTAVALPLIVRYLQGRLGRRVGLLAQDRLYAAVNRLPGLEPFEDPRFLDRVSLAQQAGSSPTQVLEGALGLAGAVVVSLGFVVSLATVSPFMMAALLGTGVPALAAHLWLSRRQGRAYWEISPRQRREMFYAGMLTDVRAAREIRLFGAGDFLRGRMRTERQAVDAIEEHLDRRTLLVQGALAAAAAIVSGAGLMWAVDAATSGRLTAGDVTIFLASVAGVQSALAMAIASAARMHQSLLLFEHYLGVLRLGAAAPAGGPVAAVPGLRTGIELRDVWFRYGPDRPWVLRGVNMVIPYGRTVALVGRNGSGKSTLVKLLCRFYDPTRGAVLWDGVDLRDLPVDLVRARISAVFQDFMQYDLTVAENVALAPVDSAEDGRRVATAADLAGVHDAVTRLPRGYGTTLSRVFAAADDAGTGVTLSGGQWQGVALARSLLRENPDLLILDEPSSGLDAGAEYDLHERLARHRAGRTTVLVSHRLSTVRDADLIVVLAGGRVVETGDHGSLIGSAGIYAGLFTTQARGYADGGEPPARPDRTAVAR
ncbi:ABC transporter ATP-binding protein [Actinoplanes sp. NPDC048967]|uniref:ABC transporter ATP-binding protein n=1 Tax=Actinoplanes sp. NPDC048967 TaxID=3155269 RepID=UPI0033C5866F